MVMMVAQEWTTSLNVAKLGSFWPLEKVMLTVSFFLFTSGNVYPPTVWWFGTTILFKKLFIIHCAMKVMWNVPGFSCDKFFLRYINK